MSQTKSKSNHSSNVYCFFYVIIVAYECEFQPGDGDGIAEEGVAVYSSGLTDQACVDACVMKKRLDYNINGVTRDARGCWCEKEMVGVNPSSRYKTCFMKEQKKGKNLYTYIIQIPNY